MTPIQWLDLCINIIGNLCAIATAIVAVLYWRRINREESSNVERLEAHLKREKEKGENKGQRSILHLVAELRLTEAEILHASFTSENVKHRRASDDTHLTTAILLEYAPNWRKSVGQDG